MEASATTSGIVSSMSKMLSKMAGSRMVVSRSGLAAIMDSGPFGSEGDVVMEKGQALSTMPEFGSVHSVSKRVEWDRELRSRRGGVVGEVVDGGPGRESVWTTTKAI